MCEFKKMEEITAHCNSPITEKTDRNERKNTNGTRGRASSAGRALHCRAEGRGFDSRGRTKTQGLKITEK